MRELFSSDLYDSVRPAHEFIAPSIPPQSMLLQGLSSLLLLEFIAPFPFLPPTGLYWHLQITIPHDRKYFRRNFRALLFNPASADATNNYQWHILAFQAGSWSFRGNLRTHCSQYSTISCRIMILWATMDCIFHGDSTRLSYG